MKKTLGIVKTWKIDKTRSIIKTWNIVLLAALIAGLCPMAAQAAIDTDIFVNMVKVETDTKPFIIDGVTYVPFRAIAEALDCQADYEGTTRTVTIEGGGITVEVVIDSVDAIVNGKPVKMNAPAIITNSRTMVPVRFIAETFNSEVVWNPGYENEWGKRDNAVEIYNDTPVTVKPLKIRVFSIKESFSHVFTTEGEWDVSSSYDVAIPQFAGLSNAVFQTKLNGDLKAMLELIAKGVQENIAEQDTCVAENLGCPYYEYFDNLYYSIVGVHRNVLTVMLDGYFYTGGAHGMPGRTAMNIDTINHKVLQLEDLFINADYEATLLKEIQALWMADEEYEYGFEKNITYLPLDNSFYFDEECLKIFYPPYELASYARGFVEFSIPLANLSSILKNEYK
ncbi:MAG: DUF4163 domain-containing protein [Peptococcaceae bacterium]|jgi:hypothetical protein|nr:DUF4163 domain-containing protein [Peptococcaceae bacterium]